MTTPSLPRVPESVFSEEFRRQPSYPAILEQVNRSPYLVDMLTQLDARGDKVNVDTANPRSAYFQPSSGDIFVGSGFFPAVNSRGEATDPNQLGRFVSMLGHEGGHAVIQDRSRVPQTPEEAGRLGLGGEGTAITAEYIVAKQLGGSMWSGPAIQSTLDATAHATGKSADIATRRTGDPAADWAAFDIQAAQQGAAYYGGLRPSTARNTTYNEYYPETWAVLNSRQGSALYRNIDWDNVQPADIEIVRRTDGSFQLVGNAVPMDEGPHAGKRVDFSADFDTRSRAAGDTLQTPRPAMALAEPAPAAMPPDQRAAVDWAKDLLGPAITSRLDPAQLDQVCAGVVAHCARHQHQGSPTHAYLSKDGHTLAFRHEPMSLSEMSVDEAARTPVGQSFRDAQQVRTEPEPRQHTPEAMVR
jgi:hypothetical protein